LGIGNKLGIGNWEEKIKKKYYGCSVCQCVSPNKDIGNGLIGNRFEKIGK
jgi:hypothetical protein